jgi:sRNA-binding regulator protein Hfq
MPKETVLKRPLDEWGKSAAQFYAEVENKIITIHLRGGQALTGELVGLDTFDLVLERENDRKVLIPKHAIEWVELAETSN